MSFEEVMAAVSPLLAATDALAAIGAELSLKSSGAGDPAFVSALDSVSAAAGLPDLDALAPQQQAMALNIVRLYFAMANELLNDPGRPAGWMYTDPLVLEGMGRGSMMIPPILAAAPEFESVSSLLDVGTGVGWLAIAAANLWPSTTVVGVDVWEPALDRARTNVKEAGLDDRITLRNQDVTELDDVDAYDCAWVPTFFLPEGALITALAKIMNALRAGGWVVLGRFEPAADPLARATMAMRNVRAGGCTLDAERSIELLRDAGFASVRDLERAGPAPIAFVIGQKPR
jgi:protein-L-isoaspartate O-methyltransferase